MFLSKIILHFKYSFYNGEEDIASFLVCFMHCKFQLPFGTKVTIFLILVRQYRQWELYRNRFLVAVVYVSQKLMLSSINMLVFFSVKTNPKSVPTSVGDFFHFNCVGISLAVKLKNYLEQGKERF